METLKKWWGCLNPTMKLLVVIAITSFILNLLKPGRLTYLGEESVRNGIRSIQTSTPSNNSDSSPGGNPRKDTKAACAIPDFFGRTIDLCKEQKK
ncbi:hypothetical protein NG798_25830 [Ancylothrix sp. C2]|nr:hypothetical protein [Ancylothrix sp. D3o]